MIFPRRIPTPELQPLARRPTGLELYQVLIPPLGPLALLVMPGDRAHLGGWSLEESARELELSSTAMMSLLISRVIREVLPICRQKGCTELAVRLESTQDAPVQPWSELLPGFTLRYRYQRLSTGMGALRSRLESGLLEDPPLTVRPLPVGPRLGGGLWNAVPAFSQWLVQLFESVFTADTDQEIAEAMPFQLALLELILAASWQSPVMNVLYQEQRPVGMVLSRALIPGRGELSFVGLLPEVRGQPAVGRQLVWAGLEPLERLSTDSVLCAVSVENGRSLAFFSRKWSFFPAGKEDVLVRRL